MFPNYVGNLGGITQHDRREMNTLKVEENLEKRNLGANQEKVHLTEREAETDE